MADGPNSDWIKREAKPFDHTNEFQEPGANREALGSALHNEYCRISDDQRQKLVAELTSKDRGSDQRWDTFGNADGQLIGIISPYALFVGTDCEKK